VALFDRSLGGVTRGKFAEEVGIPEASVHNIMARLRANATELGHTARSLKIGGVWIYGWAEILQQHYGEHYKRRKNEKRSLRLSIETLQQSVNENPDSLELRRQLVSARHRLDDVQLEMDELSGQLGLLREQELGGT
jgi:hypothetical protein